MTQNLQTVEAKPGANEQSARPSKPPEDVPFLGIVGISFGGHTLSWAPTGRSLIPKGAVRLELFYAVTDGPDDAPLSKARYWRSFLQQPIEVQFDPACDKKTATYYARWANENGEVGPFSAPVSKTIAA